MKTCVHRLSEMMIKLCAQSVVHKYWGLRAIGAAVNAYAHIFDQDKRPCTLDQTCNTLAAAAYQHSKDSSHTTEQGHVFNGIGDTLSGIRNTQPLDTQPLCHP